MGKLANQCGISRFIYKFNQCHTQVILVVLWGYCKKRQNILLKLMEEGFEDKLHGCYQPKPLYHLRGRRDDNGRMKYLENL